jgi:hypothetical protein
MNTPAEGVNQIDAITSDVAATMVKQPGAQRFFDEVPPRSSTPTTLVNLGPNVNTRYDAPRYSPDGRTLYFAQGKQPAQRAAVMTRRTFLLRRPQRQMKTWGLCQTQAL